MECKWKFGNLFTAGFKLAPKKNSAHGSVERQVHERQTMLRMRDPRHQLFPHVLLPLGLSLPVLAVWPSTLSPSHHLTRQTQQAWKPPGSWISPPVSERDRGHPICPASVKCREYTEGTQLLAHGSTVAPLHPLPKRGTHATVPPSCPKQGTARSQPLETIKHAQKKTEAQLVLLHHSPFLNPPSSKFKILL